MKTAGHGIEFKNKIAIINFTGPLYISPSKDNAINYSIFDSQKKKKKNSISKGCLYIIFFFLIHLQK